MVEWIQAAQEVQVPDTSIKHISIIFQSLSVIEQLMILPFSAYLRFSVLKSKKRHEARSVQLILCSPGKLCSTNSCDRDQAHGTKTFQLDSADMADPKLCQGPSLLVDQHSSGILTSLPACFWGNDNIKPNQIKSVLLLKN